MTQIGVLGSKGRMGHWVCQLIQTEFSASAILASHASLGDPLAPLLTSDVIIDFSSPAAICELAQLSLSRKGTMPAFVVGSTGWNADERKILEELGTKTPVLLSSNFSTGVFVLSEILREFAPLLEKLGYTPVITEAHHRHKKDAPSGTALSLQKAIDLREPGRIQTHCIRAGEVIGDHEVTFYGPADKLSVSHSAQDRSIFARGAIEVALWLATKRTGPGALRGLLDMETYFSSVRAKS